MTTQTKKFIELSDILSLRCECRQGTCRTSLVIPLADVSGRVFAVCPSCKEPWAKFLESTYELLIADFLEKLKRLNEARLGCALTLEIKDEDNKKQPALPEIK